MGSGGILGQSHQEYLFDATGAHSFQVFREHHDARDAVEYTVFFKNSDGKKQRVDLWVKNTDLHKVDDPETYVIDLVVKAVKNALDA